MNQRTAGATKVRVKEALRSEAARCAELKHPPVLVLVARFFRFFLGF